MTDADTLAAFLATKSPSTARVYHRTLDHWQAASSPDGFAAASRAQARAWWEQIQRTYQPATQRRMLHTVRSFYTFGQETAGWPANPWVAIDTPVVSDRPTTPVLHPDDLHRLLTAAEPDPRAFLIVLLLLATGIRISELAAARWQDLQRDADGGWVLMVTGRRARTLKVVAAAQAALVRYRTALGLPGALDPDDGSPVIWGRSGRPVQAGALTACVASVARLAGRPLNADRVTAQWLRTAHAVWALHAGASPEEIQTALGLHTRHAAAQYATLLPAGTTGDRLAHILPDLSDPKAAP